VDDDYGDSGDSGGGDHGGCCGGGLVFRAIDFGTPLFPFLSM
jgi:hypothetical protein